MAAKGSRAQVLQEWTERDLTAAAQKDELAPAFEMDAQVALAWDVLSSGRNLVVCGESGVGKTALVCELARRASRGEGPASLVGRRILQFSFRHRVASLKDPKLVLPATQRLIETLSEPTSDIVPFFRDLHLAYQFDLEPQLQAMAYRLPQPIIGEAEPSALRALFENTPDLEQLYVTMTIEEPDLARAAAILRAWAEGTAARERRQFSPAALDEALYLTHRFLPRGRLPRKALDLLVQVASLSPSDHEVDRDAVVTRFASAHHVPRRLVDPAAPLDLPALEAELERELLGQRAAVSAVARMVGLIKSGLSDPRRSFGVFLFVGPTGVGKTHAAQLLAQHLFGNRDRVVRLNMADHKSEDSADVLFGSPNAYTLSQRKGMLTQRTAGRPFAVLLLDEFEKAHEKVADRFLQLFDEGAFINGNGETISCRSMVVIATSNVGAEVYREKPTGFFSDADSARQGHDVDRRLVERFRFELLNRFDEIVSFQPLLRADVRRIAARELQALKERIGLKRTGMALDVDDAVLDWLAAHGYDPRHGARFLRRTLEREVTSALARVLVRGSAPQGSRLALSVRGNRVNASLITPEPEAAPKRAAVTVSVGLSVRTRRLDRGGLEAVAVKLLASAEGLLAGLESKRLEASQLLNAMNAHGFWDDSHRSRAMLDAYRRLDVALQVESRLAKPLQDLGALLRERTGLRDVERVARLVERAAEALRRWHDRSLDEGPSDVWLWVTSVDPLQPAGAWLRVVADMERAWCRRLGLEVAVVACAPASEPLTHVVLHVEGPGAAGVLAAEEGVHRRTQKDGADAKARVAVVARHGAVAPQDVHVAPVKPQRGPFGVAIACAGRVELPSRGTSFDMLGSDAGTLTEVLAALSTLPSSSSEVARVYGKDGVGARDPRTGAAVRQLKRALAGELDEFLDAWRSQSSGPSTLDQ